MKDHRASLVQILNGQGEPAADWNDLAQAAVLEGVAPLLYWQLSQTGKFATLPPSARDLLRGAYSQSWKHTQITLIALENISLAMQQAEIPLALLKGACFALTLYPDVGTRPMSDLDILLPPTQWAQGVQIAQSLGYTATTPEAAPGLNDLLSHDVQLQKDITLEIHKSLLADKTFKYAVPVHWFWTQVEPLPHPRFPTVQMLNPTAQVLYASAHAMLQHGGRMAPLRWFIDLDLMLRAYQNRIDWQALLSQADVFSWGSALYAALQQTDAHFHPPIPDLVWKQLSGRKDMHSELVQTLQKPPTTRIQEEWQNMQRLNTQGKLWVLFALVFPSPAYMKWRYSFTGWQKLWLYYPLRWWGIAQYAWRTARSGISKRK